MRKISLLLMAIAALVTFESCKDSETYADRKKKERATISNYIAKNKIKVISESEFFAHDSMTNVDKNEWVLMKSTGVYMQIVRKGVGAKIKEGEIKNLLVRFDETDLATDSVVLSNRWLYYSSLVDHMVIKNTSGSYFGVFIAGKSTMQSRYRSTAVPNGWMVPFDFINIGRPKKDGDEIAKVKLIVPSSSGTQNAINSVKPYMYELTFEEE